MYKDTFHIVQRSCSTHALCVILIPVNLFKRIKAGALIKVSNKPTTTY